VADINEEAGVAELIRDRLRDCFVVFNY